MLGWVILVGEIRSTYLSGWVESPIGFGCVILAGLVILAGWLTSWIALGCHSGRGYPRVLIDIAGLIILVG